MKFYNFHEHFPECLQTENDGSIPIGSSGCLFFSHSSCLCFLFSSRVSWVTNLIDRSEEVILKITGPVDIIIINRTVSYIKHKIKSYLVRTEIHVHIYIVCAFVIQPRKKNFGLMFIL